MTIETFPSSGGGTSWEGKTNGFSYVAPSGAAYSDIVNITGSGFLTGIDVYINEATMAYLKIVIDGTILHDNPWSRIENGGNLIGMLRFESSLQVQIKSNATTTRTYATLTYLLD